MYFKKKTFLYTTPMVKKNKLKCPDKKNFLKKKNTIKNKTLDKFRFLSKHHFKG